MVFLKKINFGA